MLPISFTTWPAIYFCAVLLLFSGPVVFGETNIADEAERANWNRVAELAKANADINIIQADGMTALHWAIWHDNTATVHQLIESKANVTAVNRYGVTPLSLACLNGNESIAETLLKAGADPNRTLPGDETPLMIAARTGSTDIVRLLIENKADINAKEHRQQTAIMWAAAEGHADVVSILISEGADFNSPLRSGFTPLFFAVREGKTEAVNVLLDAGCDVNSTMQPENGNGRSARKGTSPLMLAIENGHFELAAWLLEAGANPNDERSGFTPLHAISWVRKPNSGDGLDGTPPPIGSGNLTSLDIVRKLVEHGANVNARLKRGRGGRGRLNQTGATPFLLAADTADVPLMNLLLKLGADPSIPNADNCPPLLAAAGIGTYAPTEEAGTEEEALAATQLLLDLGADINHVDDNGETAMHGASYKSLPRMVEFLAQQGADIEIWNRRNKYGWTPHLIAEGHRPGNFKPAAATLAAVQKAMRDAGIEPPPPTPRKIRKGYQQ